MLKDVVAAVDVVLILMNETASSNVSVLRGILVDRNDHRRRPLRQRPDENPALEAYYCLRSEATV